MDQDLIRNTEEEPRSSRKLLGIALQLVSAVSLVITAAGLIVLPVLFFKGAEAAESALVTLSHETQNLADMGESLGKDLDQSNQVLLSTVDLLAEIDNLLESSQPLVNDTSLLLRETVPDLIDETSAALTAAEEGARAVDQVLRSLARIRFITGVEYDPEQSLDAGIAAAGESLEPLPDALQELGAALDNSGSGLGDFRKEMGGFSSELNIFLDRISREQDRLEGLSDQLEEISGQLENLGTRIRPAAIIISIVSELVLAGQIVIQLALYTYGQELRTRGGL
jgi:ABC-type transporter Mla subunit MlaD